MKDLDQLTDIELLDYYRELIEKKHKDRKKFDNLEIRIHGNTKIWEHWSNDDNIVEKTWGFPFSMIKYFIQELEKNGKKEAKKPS